MKATGNVIQLLLSKGEPAVSVNRLYHCDVPATCKLRKAPVGNQYRPMSLFLFQPQLLVVKS
jgi:hypothetical protein